jgi:hypothetical protein
MKPSPSPPPGANRVFSDLDERECQLRDDYEWCLHDPAIQAAYAGQVVAVHQKKVWGAGTTHADATQAALAQPGCPPREALVKVYIEGTALEANDR